LLQRSRIALSLFLFQFSDGLRSCFRSSLLGHRSPKMIGLRRQSDLDSSSEAVFFRLARTVVVLSSPPTIGLPAWATKPSSVLARVYHRCSSTLRVSVSLYLTLILCGPPQWLDDLFTPIGALVPCFLTVLLGRRKEIPLAVYSPLPFASTPLIPSLALCLLGSHGHL